MRTLTIVLSLFVLVGCGTTIMVNPETGETAQCTEGPNGFIDRITCVDGYRDLGWVESGEVQEGS